MGLFRMPMMWISLFWVNWRSESTSSLGRKPVLHPELVPRPFIPQTAPHLARIWFWTPVFCFFPDGFHSCCCVSLPPGSNFKDWQVVPALTSCCWKHCTCYQSCHHLPSTPSESSIFFLLLLLWNRCRHVAAARTLNEMQLLLTSTSKTPSFVSFCLFMSISKMPEPFFPGSLLNF